MPAYRQYQTSYFASFRALGHTERYLPRAAPAREPDQAVQVR